ncbi:MAG: hypothetical protein ACSHWV_09065 [Cellulophaga fucicola]
MKIKKIVLTVAVVILLIIIYKYNKPRYYVNNTEAKNTPCKIRPYRDSIYIYIPYQLTVYNNRLSPLRLYGIYDGKLNGSNFGKYLLFNLDNLELNSFWNGSKKLKKEDYYQNYGDDSYWRIQHTLKYKNLIIPFSKRKFYYYKRYILSNKNNRFNIKGISKDSIKKQLYSLDYNVASIIDKSITDSLYSLNSHKKINITFHSKPLIIKRIRARINSEKQEIIYINLYDSIKGRDMDKEENKQYLLNFFKRQPKDMF